MSLHMPKMTEILSRISSLSTQLHNPDGISDQDYDNHIRALLEYLREVMSNEASDIISGEISLLDVSGSFNMRLVKILSILLKIPTEMS